MLSCGVIEFCRSLLCMYNLSNIVISYFIPTQKGTFFSISFTKCVFQVCTIIFLRLIHIYLSFDVHQRKKRFEIQNNYFISIKMKLCPASCIVIWRVSFFFLCLHIKCKKITFPWHHKISYQWNLIITGPQMKTIHAIRNEWELTSAKLLIRHSSQVHYLSGI